MKRDDPNYVKSQRDDLLSMETGIPNNNSRVHFTLTQPINDQLAALDKDMEKNELIATIAKHHRQRKSINITVSILVIT